MIHVMLIILKILGIILLVLLGLILAVLVAVLFAPVRYNVKADIHGRPDVKARAFWLLHLLNARINYDDNGLYYTVRIMCFEIAGTNKKHRTESHQQESEQDNYSDADTHAEDRCDTDADDNANDTVKRCDTDADDNANDTVNRQEDENDTGASDSSKISLPERIKAFITRIRNTFTRIRDGIRNGVHHTVEWKQKVTDKYHSLKAFVDDEANIEFVRFMKQQIQLVLSHIAPVSYNINVRFGAGSPDVTGQVTGLVAVAMTFIKTGGGRSKGELNYTPEFEDKILEADAFLKGRIRIWTLLRIALRIYCNDKFKQIILKKQ